MRWLALSALLPAGSFARRCGLFICGFDMFVFFFFLGQGGGGCDAGTENRKLKISTGY